ncbi:MobF family relaxase [Haloglycomyces albus]|uniref:MobF family relaxase n=1 Tax=Haloglycomyces albus TaxID=526067 RepID=UPI00046CB443|nr:MobF family relaxase [Haloglycomyces albus]
MTVHKLTAGGGYTYLTRQTAGGDRPRQAGQSASDYYTQSGNGNPPGRWVGSGLAGLDLTPGSMVHEAQMRNLFGSGLHPNAEAIQDSYLAEHLHGDLSTTQADRVKAEAVRATKLGQKFPSYKTLEPFKKRVAQRLAQIADETGREAVSSEIAKVKREEASRQRAAVAGYDLVFSPVKSVSLLWGLHPEAGVRSEVKAAHDTAVETVMAMLEQHAALSRKGTGGAAQVDTTGLVATAFDHFDSRSGDPDLHTHLAIANKVQGTDGRWRSLDATGLYQIGVAASETYNSTIEAELSYRLGVTFTDRPGPARTHRPVREIDGVDPAMIRHFSTRRGAIEARYATLRSDYRDRHGHDPTPQAAWELAQQATLETRGSKNDTPRPLGDLVDDWRAQALAAFGPQPLEQLTRSVHTLPRDDTTVELTDDDVHHVAGCVVATVSQERATWTRWNLHSEAMRQLRGQFHFANRVALADAVDAVVETARSAEMSLQISAPAPVSEPDALRRVSGESVFTKHAAERYTSEAILEAETRLVQASTTPTVYSSAPDQIHTRLDEVDNTSRFPLDAGQRRMVEAFASDDRLLTVGIGPAGTGKTTAMRAYKHVLNAEGRRLIGLAPSAKAAAVLADDLATTCHTVDRFLIDHHYHPTFLFGGAGTATPTMDRTPLNPGDVVLVDEASMAGTFHLDHIRAIAIEAGAQVRLLGDDRQLGAVASGGALRLIAATSGATELTELHRFRDPTFASASLDLREGRTAGLDYFHNHSRLHGGSSDAMIDGVYAAWRRDIEAGKTSLMMAASNATVTDLSARARLDRINAGDVKEKGITLHDGNTAGRGDWVVTRSNNSMLKYNRGKDFVRNGTTWTVTRHYNNGSLKVTAHDSKGTITLPADYVADHVELAYAATVHRTQGSTVDTAHALLTPDMTRDHLYVAATRATDTTHLYAVTHTPLPADPDQRLDRPKWDPDATAAREIAEHILTREPDNHSATEAIDTALSDADSLATLTSRYRYAADLAATAHYDNTITTVLTGRLSRHDLGDVIDNGLPALARTLARAEYAGWDAEQLLTIAARRDLNDATSPAGVLISRITKHIDTYTAPPPGTQPTADDATRYADHLHTLYPKAHLDIDAALHPPATNHPVATSTPVSAAENSQRYQEELGTVFSPFVADMIAKERAWPALTAALDRAEQTGQFSREALTRASAQRDLDGVDSVSATLAWRVERQTHLLQLDPTHTGQAWPATAWTLKAWETTTGRDATELIDHLNGDECDFDTLALAVGQHARFEADQQQRLDAPTSLPWLDYPRHVLTTDGVDAQIRDYLPHVAEAINHRLDRLTLDAATDLPDWTTNFGPEPADPTKRDTWSQALALTAAYRDQHRITDNDPAQPLGPYIESGKAGHREWWQTAAAITTHNTHDSTTTPTGLAAGVEHRLDHAVAVDIYHSLPDDKRDPIRQHVADNLDHTTRRAFQREPDTTIESPAASHALRHALTDHGHLTVHHAAEHGQRPKNNTTTTPSHDTTPVPPQAAPTTASHDEPDYTQPITPHPSPDTSTANSPTLRM